MSELPEGGAAPEDDHKKSPEQQETGGLAALLKASTKGVHTEAESGQFMKQFVRGGVTRELYREYLARLYHVYMAMEQGWTTAMEAESSSQAGKDALQALWFDGKLARVAAIEEDLQYFFGDDWREAGSVKQPSEAAAKYAAHMTKIAASNPVLLVAHAYTRYLGDLSGGQILARVARKAMALQGDEGVAFYVFPLIQDHKEFKDEYRRTLDTLPLSPENREVVAEEAVEAFKLNISVISEMDALLAATTADAAASDAAPALEDAKPAPQNQAIPAGSCCVIA